MIQHHAPLHPGLLKVSTLTVQSLQFLLNLRTSIVASHQQLLTKLFKGLEGTGTSINLCAVFLKNRQKKKDGLAVLD